jgi:pimeloyl-ACP methyl ester carboxylesterase
VTIRRRILLLTLLILTALPIAGALYQTLSVRSESRRFPPPGQLIDIAAPGESAPRRLHLICLGDGEPTVIFEASGFGGALSSTVAREEVSAHTRVCSYDRMGMGWSDPGPGVITAGLLAGDLERLTIRAELRPPFILVPASIGGLTTELFARRHPDRVAGMVFVDAANSAILDRFVPQLSRMEMEAACLGKTAARLGILRLLDPFSQRNDPSQDAALTLSRLYRVEPVSTLCGLVRGLQSSREELSAAAALAPNIPLTVLVHERPNNLLPPGFESQARMVAREWLPLQQSFAQRSSRGTWRVVPGSDHLIGHTQPHAVAGAVLEMLAVSAAK